MPSGPRRASSAGQLVSGKARPWPGPTRLVRLARFYSVRRVEPSRAKRTLVSGQSTATSGGGAWLRGCASAWRCLALLGDSLVTARRTRRGRDDNDGRRVDSGSVPGVLGVHCDVLPRPMTVSATLTISAHVFVVLFTSHTEWSWSSSERSALPVEEENCANERISFALWNRW